MVSLNNGKNSQSFFGEKRRKNNNNASSCQLSVLISPSPALTDHLISEKILEKGEGGRSLKSDTDLSCSSIRRIGKKTLVVLKGITALQGGC